VDRLQTIPIDIISANTPTKGGGEEISEDFIDDDSSPLEVTHEVLQKLRDLYSN
jgi:hypothetical protein